MAKTLEKILHNRLYYLAETLDWLCTEQAGFRKNRTCEDQILRIAQPISDRYQTTKPKRTILTIFDCSKAFDRVWREDLLIRCLPIAYTQWLRDFFSNGKAKVQINGDRDRQLLLRQRLPQGSVLSPLLFLLYIMDLRRVISENVEVVIFADDVSLFSSHSNKEIAEAITNVAEWN